MSFWEFRIVVDEQLGTILAILAILVAVFAWIFPADVIKKHRAVILTICLVILGMLFVNHFTLTSNSQSGTVGEVQTGIENAPLHSPTTPKETDAPKSNQDDIQSAISSFYSQGFSFIDTYRSDNFALTVEKQGLVMFANSISTWGQGLYPVDDIPIEIFLINYDTRDIVSYRQSYIGETVRFLEIPAGTYFYIVLSGGYAPSFPSAPFALNTPDGQNELPTMTALLKEIGLENKPRFYVQVVNLQGNIVSDTEFQMRIAESNNPSPSLYVHCTVKTNSDGFLVPIWTSNPFDYDTQYILGENCILQLSIDGFTYYDAVPTDQNHYAVKGDW